jgi:hypothetical protein
MGLHGVEQGYLYLYLYILLYMKEKEINHFLKTGASITINKFKMQ